MRSIKQSDLTAMLGGTEATTLVFMTLSSMSIDTVVRTKYGSICRKSDTEFDIKIEQEYLDNKIDEVIEKTLAPNDVENLFK